MDQEILVRNGFIDIAVDGGRGAETILYSTIDLPVATVVSNLASYGYIVDRGAYDALLHASDLSDWWKNVEKTLKKITGADRNMGEFIVYRNFPREVLEMDRATQFIHQILIYFGVPYDMLREGEQERPVLSEEIKRLKVLALADADTPRKIYGDLVAMRNRWSDNQSTWANILCESRNVIDASDFGFKENAIALAAKQFETMEFVASSATDVLRLAAALSGADISLRETVRFRKFKRPERQRLLDALEPLGDHMAEDMAMRRGQWSRLMERLHPGDYKKYPRVILARDTLYKKSVRPFSALIDPQAPTLATLRVAQSRPGEYLRRFHHFYEMFGRDAVDHFLPVMEKLTTRQLVNFRAYLRTAGSRSSFIYAPRSNWARAKVVLNEKTVINLDHVGMLNKRISAILAKRLEAAYPKGLALDSRLGAVRLQTNDQKLAEYGRGTEFDIPENMKFIRIASYWECPRRASIWFDNGCNFFDTDWNSLGAVCWTEQHFGNKSAIFSGDPVNIHNLRGRACQMIDLYPDKLVGEGARFAVWNVLCYSRVKFSDATDVLATLQMGEHPEEGRTYEPARAQMVFPLKSPNLTSYVAYIDLLRRKLVYMDAPLPGQVRAASANGSKLASLMPAYIEYLESLPTVLEVVQDAPFHAPDLRRNDGSPFGLVPVLYDDAGVTIKGGRAYVFQPVNSKNTYERLSLTDLTNV